LRGPHPALSQRERVAEVAVGMAQAYELMSESKTRT
jgi:hypothetical protein